MVKGGCVAGGDAIATPVPISVTRASAAGAALARVSPTAGTGTVPTWTGRTGPPTAGIPPAVTPVIPSAISPGAPSSSRPLMLAMALGPDPPLHELLHEPYQLGGLEGLGEEGVHAHIEAGLDLVLRTRADDGEGQVVCTGIGPEAGGGAEPVQPGHDDVERHDVGPHLVDHVQTLGTIGRGHDL
ncbi:hypothetical protein ADL02_32705 [Streptomyces sp. NRRL WC-3723]|nr:hypothetical protein ADL02_32705 [Streptomyces sp. NRRL WC-3723]